MNWLSGEVFRRFTVPVECRYLHILANEQKVNIKHDIFLYVFSFVYIKHTCINITRFVHYVLVNS